MERCVLNSNSFELLRFHTIKNEGAIVFTTFSTLKVHGKNFRCSMASNSKTNGLNWPEIELM